MTGTDSEAGKCEPYIVNGFSIPLDRGREVFVGRADGHEGVYMSFLSEAGAVTRLRLSDEAMEALVQLWDALDPQKAQQRIQKEQERILRFIVETKDGAPLRWVPAP